MQTPACMPRVMPVSSLGARNAKSWGLRVRPQQQASLPGTSVRGAPDLKRAREFVAEARQRRSEGKDPIEHPRKAGKGSGGKVAKPVKFREVADGRRPAPRQPWVARKSASAGFSSGTLRRLDGGNGPDPSHPVSRWKVVVPQNDGVNQNGVWRCQLQASSRNDHELLCRNRCVFGRLVRLRHRCDRQDRPGREGSQRA
jgi:hypothetical protein